MKIIFQIEGGIGKNIAATAVCKAIKKQFPQDDLIVLTPYPEVFLCNPNIYKTLDPNSMSYFYKDHVAGQQVKMLLHNPYFETDFVAGSTHLIQVWCEMFGIAYNGELPELYINSREQAFYAAQFASQKPIMVMQTNGGGANQSNKYSWARDIPLATAQKVVDAFTAEYNIVHIRRNDQLSLKGTTPLQANFRAIAVLIALSEKRLLIDSFAQHVAAALGKPSVVCWIGNSPVQYGYEIHTNIIAHEPTLKPELRHSVYTKYNITGSATEFPYNNEAEVFNATDIIGAIKDPGNNVTRSTGAGNQIIKDKITVESNKGSMVAKRLVHLLDKIDLNDVSCILDIGSWHLGQSIEFSKVFPQANINAFEPVPESYKLCLETLANLDEQKKNRLKIHNIALSNKAGEIAFYPVIAGVNENIDVGFSSMFKFNEEIKSAIVGEKILQKEITVQARTLDTWCIENGISEVDIMWVDVQGAELLVFQGAEEILKHTKVIMTEVGLTPYYDRQTLKDDIDIFLLNLGFEEMKESVGVNTIGFNGIVHEVNTIYMKRLN